MNICFRLIWILLLGQKLYIKMNLLIYFRIQQQQKSKFQNGKRTKRKKETVAKTCNNVETQSHTQILWDLASYIIQCTMYTLHTRKHKHLFLNDLTIVPDSLWNRDQFHNDSFRF